MKRIIMMMLLFWSGFAFAAQNYTLDPSHTYVEWHISHFGFSEPSGKWMIKGGTLVLDKAKPQNSKVDVTIDLNDLSTGLPELDKHLKAPLFFDVAKYPTATYVSNKVILTGKETAKVEGVLTLHGVSKPVTLNVKFNKSGENPVTNLPTVGFSATAVIQRSDFGISAYSPGLGDTVKLNIQAEASRAN